MPKKIYRTYSLRGLSYNFEDKKGNLISVNFRGGAQLDSTAIYTTSNEEIQQMLESSRDFGRDFYLDSVEEVAKPEPEEVKKKEAELEADKPLADVKDIRRFKNLPEMKSAMAELGFEGVSSMNYAQCKAAAVKAGYDFQILKK